MRAVRRGLHGQVVHVLVLRILRGQYPPGTVLPNEADFGAELKVSRTVLREAIKVLAAKGFIETRPKTGTRVCPRAHWRTLDPDVLAWQYEDAEHDEKLLRDLMDVRQMIEPGAAEIAARRGGTAEIAAIETAFHDMQRSVTDSPAFIEADMQFHTAILMACENELLSQLSRTVGIALRATRRVTTRVPGASAAALPRHQAVLEAIQARKPEAARSSMLELLDCAASDIERILHPTDSKTA